MPAPLYTIVAGFDKAAIMRATWDACRALMSLALLSLRDRRLMFADAHKKAWRIG